MKLGEVIRHLLDRKLTSVAEIETITGRGSSTVYRWINEESEPHTSDLGALVRGLADPEARRTAVSLLTSDLPVAIRWLDENEGYEVEDDHGRCHNGHDVLSRTLLALDCLSHALNLKHEALRTGEMTGETAAELIVLMDQAIGYLASGRNMLTRHRND